jgi:hypothetical protein
MYIEYAPSISQLNVSRLRKCLRRRSLREPLSRHANARCIQRGIPRDAIDIARRFGNVRTKRHATIWTVGWREIEKAADEGLDISRFNGIQVVEGFDGKIITAYRAK